MNDEILKKLLKKILKELAGTEAEKIVEILYGKKNVNEFIIAKKLNLTINQTRNILYKLGDEGLVSFVRKKDNKKGGWYIYFWTLETEKGLEKYKDKTLLDIGELNKQLKNRESERYYQCKNCSIELNEENALLNNYTCPECGETVEVKEPTEIINSIKVEIKKLDDNLIIINQELTEMEAKDVKSKERKMKVELKKKEEERAEKKRIRDKEKKKMLKEGGIKPKPSKKASKDSKSPKSKKPAKKKK